MRVRIISGKLRPGTWDAYEAAYKEVMAKSGQVPGLRARWLARDVKDPDAGYWISLWEDEASMRAYEGGDVLKKHDPAEADPLLLGRIHDDALRDALPARDLNKPRASPSRSASSIVPSAPRPVRRSRDAAGRQGRCGDLQALRRSSKRKNAITATTGGTR